MINLKWHPSPSELRVFAIGQLVLFTLVAARLLVAGHSVQTAAAIFVPSAAVAIVGLIQASWLRWLYIAWMALVFPIGWAVSHLLLLAVFCLCIVPLGLILKSLRFDPLQRQFDPDRDSYWETRKPAPPARRYFRPF